MIFFESEDNLYIDYIQTPTRGRFSDLGALGKI